ncbi:hypothetical protein B0H13DRAFT_2535231 [Mycena leptocephala]|nr:hypothetical protein B0H13DRAFT_2535231 [Mycena leptocephala]
MPANTWTTPEQLVFLLERLPAYLKAKENQKKVPLKRFWAVLEEEWFARWPPEEELKLPARTPTSDPWTPEQTQALGDATKLTKRRLPAWMRYQDAHRNQGGGTTSTTTGTKQKSLFRILKDSAKATRPIRVVEMYQKLYKSKIQQAGLEHGNGDLDEGAEGKPVDAETATQAGLGEVHLLTADELAAAELTADLLTIQRVQKNRAARMSIWRTRSIQMWADESEEVKAEVVAATQEENERRAEAADNDDDDDKTPEQYQHAINQIGAVYAKVHAATMEETGWYGVTLLGGPMPRRGGQISTKTICFGLTPHGNDFASSTPQFPDFKAAFQQWTKRAFPHEVRDARGIPLPGSRDAPLPPDPLDGLIAMAPPASSDDEEDTPDTPAPAPVARKAVPARAKPRASVNVATVVPAPTASSATSVSVTSASADATPDFTPNDPPTILKEPVDFTSENLALPPFPMYENFDPFTVPENFDEILAHMDLPELDSNSDAEFLLAKAWDGENGDYNGANGSLDDTGGASLRTDAMDARRPAPRPIHAGAPFTADRGVGGSPGRVPQSGTVEVNGFNFPPSLDYRPSVLLQAFKKPSPTPLPASPAIGFTFGSSSSPVFASPTPEASRNVPITSVVNATVTPPPTTASTATPTTASTTAPSIPPSLSTTPSTAAPAPRPAFSFSHGRPSPRQTAAASLLTSIIADATAAVHAVTQPGITPPTTVPVAPPQYIQSRPMGNPPKTVPVARAAKTKKRTKPSGTGRLRGRPRKNPLPDRDENTGEEHTTLPPADQPLPPVAAVVTEPVVPAPALLSGAASRAEAARQRRHDAELRTSRAQALAREKEMIEDAEAKRAAAAAEAKRLHNPAGGADLFITGSRPKRAIMAAKNPDGTDIVRTVKRTREELAVMARAEDQRMLDGFARQKETEKAAGTTAAKKRKAAAPAAETAAKKRKTAPAAPATKIMRARSTRTTPKFAQGVAAQRKGHRRRKQPEGGKGGGGKSGGAAYDDGRGYGRGWWGNSARVYPNGSGECTVQRKEGGGKPSQSNDDMVEAVAVA